MYKPPLMQGVHDSFVQMTYSMEKLAQDSKTPSLCAGHLKILEAIEILHKNFRHLQQENDEEIEKFISNELII